MDSNKGDSQSISCLFALLEMSLNVAVCIKHCGVLAAEGIKQF
jgi:hypothetical protein